MYIEYLDNVLGTKENKDDSVLKKIEKMYNTQYYDEGSNQYNPSTVLKSLGIYDTTKTTESTQEQQPTNNSESIPEPYKPSAYRQSRENYTRQLFNDIIGKGEMIKKTHERAAQEEKNQLLEFVTEQLRQRQLYQNSNQQENSTNSQETNPTDTSTVNFNANADENSLGNMDVKTELPKLTVTQIKDIITTHFPNSTVITPSDAEGIYNAQQTSGLSALAMLGIGALESGYGTSNIAQKKNNIWGWGTGNTNRMENAKSFSQMSTGALEFSNAYLKTYYDGYGAKTINSAGTGDNPAKKGYSYNDDGTIEIKWASDVSSIMKKFYQTAKKSAPERQTNTQTNTQNTQNNTQTNTQNNNQTNTQNTSNLTEKVGQKIADVSNYNNSAAKGQCVWYVRGRMKQKFGKDTGSLGNGNQMWYNAKDSAKLAPIATNIKPNIIASYETGLSQAGKKYGHVLYIEDVVGDDVYYTEGGSYYYNNGTIGTLKKTTKKEILSGSSKFGYGLIGFIDAANY